MHMEFKAPIMRSTELITEMGFPEEYLMNIFRTPGQTIARKINPKARNSPIIFDTEGLEKWWKQHK